MSRDARLTRLSRDHHHALTLALRIQRELGTAEPPEVSTLVRDVLRYWDEAMTPHFAVEARSLFPLLAAVEEGGLALAARAQGGQRELQDLVTEVRGSNAATRTGILVRFGAALAAQIRWEERELLEWAQAHLGDAGLDAVAREVAAVLPVEAVPCPVPHLA